MMITRMASPTAMRIRIFMSFLKPQARRRQLPVLPYTPTTRSADSPPLRRAAKSPSAFSAISSTRGGERAYHLLPHPVGTPPEPLRRDGQVVCKPRRKSQPPRPLPLSGRPGLARAPVLSWSAFKCSPRSATLLMLSRMIPTVSSICAWMAAVLELPVVPGATGAPVGFVEALPPR